ncbi:GH1 family beta-glucosidase [Cryptosporangium aurantiacum]|uniref:Beta-glucosidase n=1 Tax=Cryptosporangium aurantiacum TaxID=134849 RepID=A0A1M7R3G4_9ACTN|nr:GH1 family beta-glucosidase [Cryptosporangium aurantiacum]SHN39537.1 broad-specificity cellobiase [Cryptosporangium aurantiacum]
MARSPASSDITFPPGFVWGAATASYQIEGAAHEDGRGPSIWDTFSHTPGAVVDGHTGDVACDHYHRYSDDVALMAEVGLQAYRFSVAWPRIQPDGSGPINPAGLDFYDRLVDELRGHDIEPVITLYHWDLPQALEDRGGWTDRDTAHRLAEYAEAVHARLGDRVDVWTTLNEPWCAAFLGYAAGVHAPGRTDPAAAFAAAHHLNLGHGLTVRALRAAGASTLGVTVNPALVLPTEPADAGHADAVRLVDGLRNRIFLDPMLRGEYSEDVLEHIERFTEPTFIHDGDAATIGAPIELLGVNYYRPTHVAAGAAGPASPAYPGTERVEFRPDAAPHTDMGWAIEPDGLRQLLEKLSRDYPGTPLYVTENGAAYPTGPDADSRVPDAERIRYLDAHLRAAHQALTNGVDLRGYFVWSLLDNFEWAEGYSKRFGLVYVDYRTQRRVLKDSALWYEQVVRRNGLPKLAT